MYINVLVAEVVLSKKFTVAGHNYADQKGGVRLQEGRVQWG